MFLSFHGETMDIYRALTEKNSKTEVSSIYDVLTFDSFLEKVNKHPVFDRDLYGLLLADSELSYFNDCYLPDVKEAQQSKDAYQKFALNYERSAYDEDFVFYFNEHFSKIVKKRIFEGFNPQNADAESFSILESQFYKTYKQFSNIQSLHSSQINILLKKFFILNRLHPNLIDSTSRIISLGSSLFLLELFIQLGSFQKIERFQNGFFKMDQTERRKLLSSPVLILCPWNHQKEAFDKWCMNKSKGIIEMATGTGKTFVGLMAIENLSHNLKVGEKANVRILAHSKSILNQWRSEAIRKFGLSHSENGSHESSLICSNITIHFNTVQKIIYDTSKEIEVQENLDEIEDEIDANALEAAANSIKMSQLNTLYPSDLIIVDEVHHSAAPVFRKIYGINSKQKLGLSATVDESSGVKLSILEKELGPVVYQFGLREAMDSGVLPRFRWDYNVIYLDTSENQEFEKLTKVMLTLFVNINENPRGILNISKKMEEYCADKRITFPKRYHHKSSFSNLGDFIDFCAFARLCKIKLPENWIKLEIHIFKRREIIHNSKPKLEEATKKAEEYLDAGKKIIMFLKRTDSCDEIAETIRSHGYQEVFVVHSKIPKYEQNLEAFKKEKSGILIGANILNEGLDIPDAEIGINVSSSKTKLELIQRIGRVIRNKPGKNPIFVHYDAIPQSIEYEGFDKNLLSYIEDISLAEDIAWSQETALSLNIDLVVNDTNSNDLKRMEQHIEKSFKDNLVHSDDAFNVEFETAVGPLKLAQILKPFYSNNKPYLILVENLSKLDKNEISDAEWFNLVRQSFSKKEDESLNLPGHYWILLLGGRNPLKIIKILKKDASFVNVASAVSTSPLYQNTELKTPSANLHIKNTKMKEVRKKSFNSTISVGQTLVTSEIESKKDDFDKLENDYERDTQRLNAALRLNDIKRAESKKSNSEQTEICHSVGFFENLTGAKVVDCILESERIIFVIHPGEMGLAIGTRGKNVNCANQKLGKPVELVEYSNDPVLYLKNLFGVNISIKAISFVEMNGKKAALVEIADKDKGLAIGKNKGNISKIKLLMKRHHGVDDVFLT